MRGRHQPDEIAIAGLVARQQGEMIGRVALRIRPILDRTRRHVGLDTDDRLDPGLRRRLIKFNRAVQVAVIGNRDRRHPHFGRLFHQLLHPHRAVEKRILGVEMEMNEGVGGHATATINSVTEASRNPRFCSRNLCPSCLATNLKSHGCPWQSECVCSTCRTDRVKASFQIILGLLLFQLSQAGEVNPAMTRIVSRFLGPEIQPGLRRRAADSLHRGHFLLAHGRGAGTGTTHPWSVDRKRTERLDDQSLITPAGISSIRGRLH